MSSLIENPELSKKNIYLIKKNPTSAGQRHLYRINKKILWTNAPFKRLTIHLKSALGRNSRGVITIKGREAGHKKKYRRLYLKNNIYNIPSIIKRVEYNTYGTSFINLLYYLNSTICYLPNTENQKKYNIFSTKKNIRTQMEGSSTILKNIPIGTSIFNIESIPGKGSSLAKSAGSAAILLSKESYKNKGILKLPSGKIIEVSLFCKAFIGMSSNFYHNVQIFGKAGISRLKGRRPHTRGVAMNPVDHPHGGGEGKTSGGRISVTPYGFHTKGRKTRKRQYL